MKRDSATIPQRKFKALIGKNGLFGTIASSFLMSFLGINKINRICRPIEHLRGMEFAREALKLSGVKIVFNDEDLAQIPAEGPFIICANHPFGSIDGLALIDIIGKKRPDIKVLANFILSSIPALEELFLPVNPFTETKGGKSSHKGIRMALEHVSNGGALAIFPSGEVSSDRNPEHVVKDIEWQTGVIRLIKGAEVPVVPVYFHGENSKFFHFVGRIHPRLRTIRLPHEYTNKKGKVVDVKIGKMIPASEINSYQSPKELASYLWNRTYALEADVTSNSSALKSASATIIDPHIDPAVLKKEREGLTDKILYNEAGYTCYLTKYEEIPNIIREIGVCREETFRNVGEGSNLAIDLDDYDKYYYHMHLWKDDSEELVGAYRIGLGNEIIEKRGLNGFYSNQFFRYDKSFEAVLSKTMELGRSFIVTESQKKPMSLNMLFKGLFCVMNKFSNLKYFIGPASITSAMPLLYRSLIVDYLNKSRFNPEFSKMVHPSHPFTPDYLKLNPEELIKADDSIEQFDRLLLRLSGGRFRTPTLVRKYSKLNGTFLAFNVDPDFNYSLDGLVLVDIDKLPEEELSFLQKKG